VKSLRNLFQRHEELSELTPDDKLAGATELAEATVADYEAIRKSGLFHRPLDPVAWDVTDQDVVKGFERNLEEIRRHLSEPQSKHPRRAH
jgi:hypothetical protein